MEIPYLSGIRLAHFVLLSIILEHCTMRRREKKGPWLFGVQVNPRLASFAISEDKY
jgi:hypothetical protein